MIKQPELHQCAECPRLRSRLRRGGRCEMCLERHRLAGTLEQVPDLRRTSRSIFRYHNQPPGLSLRQADYWVRQGWLKPNNARSGSGTARVWDEQELKVADRMRRLVAAGLTPNVA